jgi:Tfp pilus assembly protein PilE
MSFFKTLVYSFLPQDIVLASMRVAQDKALEEQRRAQEEYYADQEYYYEDDDEYEPDDM